MKRISLPDRDKSLGIFVRRRRRANGLSQQALAELAGVGARLVGELERGKRTLRMDAVNAVLGTFGRQLGPVELPRVNRGVDP